MAQGLQGQNRLNRTGGPEQVPQLAFWCGDRQAVKCGPQAAAQGPGLGQVANGGAGGVGLHKAEVAHRQICPTQGIGDGEAGLQTLRFGGHDVMAITAATASQQPAQGRGGGRCHVPFPLQHQHAGAF